ncbi:MAG: UPF0147 family protein [Candidatus Thermoplasmatota archaeon]|nr:UPF0147 family protein [Candidatus Thermoplasmatota archaeon]
MSDLDSRIKQIAQVLTQLDDNQVPRNIRSAAKESVDKWLLNGDKDMDVRLGMTASILDEIFNDPNLPGHYGPLCLQIQAALEEMLNEVSRS